MYGIFESTENRLVGVCSSREKADIYVATENLDWDYDHYYVEELESLDDDIVKCGDRLKKNYNIAFNFPLSTSLDLEFKKSFHISELEVVDRRDNYYPYFGEERPISIKAFNSCILISLTASDYDLAVEKATDIIKEVIADENEYITFKGISKNLENWSNEK